MADTLTTNYSWIMPQDQFSSDTWGQKLNGDLAAIDAQVWNNAHGYDVIAYSSTGIPATFSFYNSAAPTGQQIRWQWQMDQATESGTTTGSNLNLVAYDNTGIALPAIPLTISRVTGPSINTSGSLSVPTNYPGLSFSHPSLGTGNISLVAGGFKFGGSIFGTSTASITAGSVNATGPVTIVPDTGNSASYVHLNGAPTDPTHGPGATVGYQEGGVGIGSTFWGIGSGLEGISLTIESSSGNLTFATRSFGQALKAGGGPWSAISDERIKTVEAEYLHGLEEVCQLRPVVYRYRGNDGGAHDPDKEHIGLVAQEVEAVMPEMVTMKEGVIDGEPVSDLRTLDTTALVFALVNAVKQLSARVAELEAR